VLEYVPFLVVAVLAVGLVSRLIMGHLDRERIETSLRERGALATSIEWAPFGTGWFGEKSERIYEVRFTDRDGNLCAGTFKTSMLSGVYSTNEHVLGSAGSEKDEEPSAAGEGQDLAAENARLRAELERLRASDRR
jgi:hypothetical protein